MPVRTLARMLLAASVIGAGFGYAGHAIGARNGAERRSRVAEVLAVLDGDTLVIVGGERVRLIGIDAPEVAHGATPAECHGDEAAVALGRLTPLGGAVRLKFDVERHDRYGRTLAYVWVDDTFVNAALVRDGHARPRTVGPNVVHQRDLEAAGSQAHARRVGVWGRACEP